MMKWFRRKQEKAAAVTPEPDRCYRVRVEAFWEWWSRESERLLASVTEDGGRDIEREISDQVSWLCPDLAWVFGPNPDGEGHSFTISSEGNAHRRHLIGYWLEKAPTLPGWTFYPSRQPSVDFGGTKLRMNDVEVSAASLWIAAVVDEGSEKIDITVWSPTFAEIDEDHAWRILFIYLDEALGEDGSERCLGSIDLGDTQLANAFPLTELPEYVDSVFAKHGWNRDALPWGTYEIAEPLGEFPRGDIFVGATQSMRLLNDYANEGGPIEDPLLGSGAELIFLRLSREVCPEGGELDFRNEIIDALTGQFQKVGAGIGLGGAMGRQFFYIDLLLFDGARARKVIADVLKDRGVVEQCQEFSFVK